MEKSVIDHSVRLAKKLGYDVDSILGTYHYLYQHRELVAGKDIWKVVEERIRKFVFRG